MAKKLTQFWKRVVRGAHRLDVWTQGWLGLLAGAAKKALGPDTASKAAAIAYFAIFSLFPVTLLSVAIASFSLGSLMDQQMVVQRLEFIAPALGQLLGENIDEIIAARGPVTIVAAVGLLWTASTVFYVLTGTMNDIWEVERSRPFWKRRGQAILFVLVFVGPVLFLASFANNLIATLFSGLPSEISLILGETSFAMALLLDIAFFWAIYILFPHGHSAWRKLLPGAIAAGLLWEFAKKVFLAFVSTYISVSNLVYGSVAAIIAFLIWAFLSGHILLFGAFLNVAYNRKLSKQRTAKPKRSKRR